MNNTCPFCSTGIENQVFLGNKNMLAIYNLAPILPGHSMVIPRRHVETIFDLNENELAELFRFSRKVTALLMKVFGGEGFDWSLQESEAAGQSVTHLHLHIIPRKPGDLARPGDWYAQLEEQRRAAVIDDKGRKPLSSNEIKNVITFIKNHLG
jgi:bis(5'-adenosyl)-triphosphatase